MKFNYKEITLQNCIDNEKHYEFNCDGDRKEVIVEREENNESKRSSRKIHR